MDYKIRPIEKSELYVLENMLYEAIFQRPGEKVIPRSILENPEISVYIDNYGQKDDYCFVVEVEEKIMGAVWTRILSEGIKGFGNIDNETPEFAISLYSEYRNKGIGTKLMKIMIEYLKEKGYKKASLSVQKDNYAVKMYEKVGFEIIKEQEEDYLMVINLN